MFKYYGAFIVSERPIDLSSIEKDLTGVQHLLCEEFELDGNGKGGWKVEVDAQKYCGNQGIRMVEVEGSTVSNVIINWFKALVRSMAYRPLREKN